MSAAEPAIALDDAAKMREALTSIASSEDPQHLIDIVVKLLLQLSSENKRLQLRFAKALRGIHGRKSEKLSVEQLALFRELLDDAGESKKDEKSESHERKPREKNKERLMGAASCPLICCVWKTSSRCLMRLAPVGCAAHEKSVSATRCPSASTTYRRSYACCVICGRRSPAGLARVKSP
jgi:hypothetical protein